VTHSLGAAHVVVSLFPPLPVLILLILVTHRKRHAAREPVAKSPAVEVAERDRLFVLHAQTTGIAISVCLAAWAMTGAGYFWPGWVIIAGVATVALHARSAFAHSC